MQFLSIGALLGQIDGPGRWLNHEVNQGHPSNFSTKTTPMFSSFHLNKHIFSSHRFPSKPSGKNILKQMEARDQAEFSLNRRVPASFLNCSLDTFRKSNLPPGLPPFSGDPRVPAPGVPTSTAVKAAAVGRTTFGFCVARTCREKPKFRASKGPSENCFLEVQGIYTAGKARGLRGG